MAAARDEVFPAPPYPANTLGVVQSLAEPEDIADVVVFLATDDARHLIGQLIHVNGGDYHG